MVRLNTRSICGPDLIRTRCPGHFFEGNSPRKEQTKPASRCGVLFIRTRTHAGLLANPTVCVLCWILDGGEPPEASFPAGFRWKKRGRKKRGSPSPPPPSDIGGWGPVHASFLLWKPGPSGAPSPGPKDQRCAQRPRESRCRESKATSGAGRIPPKTAAPVSERKERSCAYTL
jgi:hypothetical protein